MPVLRAGSGRAAPPQQPPQPNDAALSLADVAWTLARIDACDALELAAQVVTLAERVQNGDRWMAAHPEHLKRHEYGSLLYRLASELRLIESQLLRLEQACWLRCRETYAIIQRAADGDEIQARLFENLIAWDASEPALPLWRMLLPFRIPPDPPTVGGVPVVLPRGDRTGAALWELDELRACLAMKASR